MGYTPDERLARDPNHRHNYRHNRTYGRIARAWKTADQELPSEFLIEVRECRCGAATARVTARVDRERITPAGEQNQRAD